MSYQNFATHSNLSGILFLLRIHDLTILVDNHGKAPVTVSHTRKPADRFSEFALVIREEELCIRRGQPTLHIPEIQDIDPTISSFLTPLTLLHADITQASLKAMIATTSTPALRSSWSFAMYGGICDA